eukprot:scaffold11868_cov24-Tisochrysis_lutea.AAC.2
MVRGLGNRECAASAHRRRIFCHARAQDHLGGTLTSAALKALLSSLSQVMRVHKIILEARSPVFHALLTSPMREGQEGRVKVCCGRQSSVLHRLGALLASTLWPLSPTLRHSWLLMLSPLVGSVVASSPLLYHTSLLHYFAHFPAALTHTSHILPPSLLLPPIAISWTSRHPCPALYSYTHYAHTLIHGAHMSHPPSLLVPSPSPDHGHQGASVPCPAALCVHGLPTRGA